MAVIVALLIFGVTQRVFKSFGVSYPIAFAVVGVFIGCAFIPTFSIGAVEVSVAGFIAPVVFAAMFVALSCKLREIRHALVAASAVAALYIAIELIISPLVNAVISALIIGLCCGTVAYLVGKTKLSSVCAVFLGMPIADVIASAVNLYAYGTPLRLGSAATFDAVIISAVTAVVIYEAVAAIRKRSMEKKRALAETAQEFDPNEYKRYFDE